MRAGVSTVFRVKVSLGVLRCDKRLVIWCIYVTTGCFCCLPVAGPKAMMCVSNHQ